MRHILHTLDCKPYGKQHVHETTYMYTLLCLLVYAAFHILHKSQKFYFQSQWPGHLAAAASRFKAGLSSKLGADGNKSKPSYEPFAIGP